MAKRTYTFWADKLKGALIRANRMRRVLQDGPQVKAGLSRERERYLEVEFRQQMARQRRRLLQLEATKIPYYRERLGALRLTSWERVMRDDPLEV